VARIEWPTGKTEQAREALLSATLRVDGREVATNRWPFWVHPLERQLWEGDVVYAIEDASMARQVRHMLPGAIDVRDFDSAVRGLLHWRGTDCSESLKHRRVPVLIADTLGDAARAWIAAGLGVLLIDSGRFDTSWYPGELTGTTKMQGDSPDVNCLFSSFRTGWDRGPVASVITPHPALGDFPHNGYCDLQFYSMVQDAKPLSPQHILDGAQRETIIRSVPILRDDYSTIRTEDRAFLMHCAVGDARVLVSSMHHDLDAAGLHLLRCMLRHLLGPAQ
jgi:hypothetical protein